jgi:uncharacterized protein (DUF885 family)
MKKAAVLTSFILVLAACDTNDKVASTQTKTPPTVAQTESTEENRFADVMASITRDWLSSSPESASALGVSEERAGGRYINRLGLTGLAGREKKMALVKTIVKRLEGLDMAALTKPQREMVEVQLFRYRPIIEIGKLVDYGTPYLTQYGPMFEPYAVAQMNGPHVEFTSMLENDHPVTNADEAAAFIERLVASSDMLSGLQEEVLADAEKGVVPPDFIIATTEKLLRNIIAVPPQDSPIYSAFKARVNSNQIEGEETLLAQALDALAMHTYPGYAALADTLASLKDGAPHTASLSRLPNGDALYKAMIKLNTDTHMTANEIHQIGLDNVTRIHAEMDTIMKTAGLQEGSVPERLSAMSRDPALVYPDTEEYKEQTLEEVRAMIAAIDEVAPQYFGTLPKAKLEVRRVPAFREASSAGGYYNGPSEDGTRPGIYYLNLRSTSLIPTYRLPTITYHEAVPGHHFQVALGLERKELPLLHRINTNTNAFAEGWGLYAERLAWEMGMYEGKPLADIGRLSDELHRAVRLVVDTGMHAKGWSREEAIDYMATTKGAEASGMGSEVVSEIERYVAMPGQALGYMIGMQKILELRAEAKAQLKDSFDIRAFHDAVLIKGGLPLPLLEKNVRTKLSLSEK